MPDDHVRGTVIQPAEPTGEGPAAFAGDKKVEWLVCSCRKWKSIRHGGYTTDQFAIAARAALFFKSRDWAIWHNCERKLV